MEFIARHKKIVLSIMVLLCAVAIIVTVYFRDSPSVMETALGYVVVPVQRGISSAGGWITGKIDFFRNMSLLEEENELLKEELERLKEDNNRLKLIETDNVRLRELFELDLKYPNYPKVGANVVAKNPGNWHNTFEIDKGYNNGLTKNMVVMTSNGLVGRIIEAGANYSKVLSLIDDTSSVSAMSVRTEDLGDVKGDVRMMKNGLCIMDKIDIDAEIIEGDEIITSHLGDIYPPGITIGFVEELRTNSNGLTKYAVIRPVVDFKHIDTVLVINQSFERKTSDPGEINETDDDVEKADE